MNLLQWFLLAPKLFNPFHPASSPASTYKLKNPHHLKNTFTFLHHPSSASATTATTFASSIIISEKIPSSSFVFLFSTIFIVGVPRGSSRV